MMDLTRQVDMYRVLGVLLALAVLSFPAEVGAQGRGGHGGVAGARGGPVIGGTGVGVSPFRIPGTIGASGIRGSGAIRNNGFRGNNFNRFNRPVVVAPFGFGYSPFYSPFYSPYYSPFDWSTPASPAYTYSEPAPAPAYTPPPASSDTSVDLAYQVGRLSEQIAELRAEQSTRGVQPAGAPGPGTHTATTTVLVFRDGHREEIQNYAIVGQTLWILDENKSSRIPVSELDVAATQAENRQRGVRFTLPD
jgi:hypothetical protein